MIYKLSDNIVSPLGFSSEENFAAICRGESKLQYYTDKFGVPEPFFASLFNKDELSTVFQSLPNPHNIRYTRLEQAAIFSAYQAISQAGIDPSSQDVLFIFSTTKGNIELLDHPDAFEKERVYLWRSATLTAQYFNNPNTPIVISNACISGCAAQLAAFNYLQYQEYKYAVVIGVEVLSKFIISGFQSFKALSPERCKPFDANRCGLNLGEAAATIIYGKNDPAESLPEGTIILQSGAINNDANHISGPSRTGEGLMRAIQKSISHFNTAALSFINAHGTATPYNDDMESIAIERSGLLQIPVNSLKGYYGHTLGAAGILECILSSHALQNKLIIKSMGTEHPGTVKQLNICLETAACKGTAFMKLISGFGGSNAALLFIKTTCNS